jgi:hypothetical protein
MERTAYSTQNIYSYRSKVIYIYLFKVDISRIAVVVVTKTQNKMVNLKKIVIFFC